jgi:hypothetical protein
MLVMDTEQQDSGCHCRQPGAQLNVVGVVGRRSSNLTGIGYHGRDVRSSRVDSEQQDSGCYCQQTWTKSDVGSVGGRCSHNPSGLDYRGRSVINRPPMNVFRKSRFVRLAVRSSVDLPPGTKVGSIRVEQDAAANRHQLRNFKANRPPPSRWQG